MFPSISLGKNIWDDGVDTGALELPSAPQLSEPEPEDDPLLIDPYEDDQDTGTLINDTIVTLENFIEFIDGVKERGLISRQCVLESFEIYSNEQTLKPNQYTKTFSRLGFKEAIEEFNVRRSNLIIGAVVGLISLIVGFVYWAVTGKRPPKGFNFFAKGNPRKASDTMLKTYQQYAKDMAGFSSDAPRDFKRAVKDTEDFIRKNPTMYKENDSRLSTFSLLGRSPNYNVVMDELYRDNPRIKTLLDQAMSGNNLVLNDWLDKGTNSVSSNILESPKHMSEIMESLRVRNELMNNVLSAPGYVFSAENEEILNQPIIIDNVTTPDGDFREIEAKVYMDKLISMWTGLQNQPTDKVSKNIYSFDELYDALNDRMMWASFGNVIKVFGSCTNILIDTEEALEKIKKKSENNRNELDDSVNRVVSRVLNVSMDTVATCKSIISLYRRYINDILNTYDKIILACEFLFKSVYQNVNIEHAPSSVKDFFKKLRLFRNKIRNYKETFDKIG